MTCGRQITLKRVRLWMSSWIELATRCRPNSEAARSLAMAAQAGLVGGQARAFGIARCGAPLGVGQVGAEPAVALGQRLRMGQHDLDAVERILAGASGGGAPAG